MLFLFSDNLPENKNSIKILNAEKLYAKPKEVNGDGKRTKILTEYRQKQQDADGDNIVGMGWGWCWWGRRLR